MIFFLISKVLPFRDLRISLSFKGRISFLKPLLTSLLRFSILFLFRCCICIFFSVSACVLTQSCILPVTHAAKHTQVIRPFSRTCDTRRRTPGPAHQGERMVPCWGRFVGGDEPGSSALSPDIHTQWVHSHTCLIAWPIGGGAHQWWRPLESEDRRIVMVRGSSQFVIKVIFTSAFCCV